ncbi:PEP-CTERM sorting domain-containing protein [Methylomonas sp. CM2]|uniref:PEP-CTERM sorting domain-containing protein n=1 Tax=Methylomonas sp. CM2 TaxID=3417647 RepID=UPI003CF1273B
MGQLFQLGDPEVNLVLGHLSINPDVTSTPAVPVPGAVWLFGTGLLGLLGLKRRGRAG